MSNIAFTDFSNQNIETLIIKGKKISCLFFSNLSIYNIYIPLLDDDFIKKIDIKSDDNGFILDDIVWIDVVLVSSNTTIKGAFIKLNKFGDNCILLILDMNPIINARIEKKNSTNKKEEVEKMFVKLNRLRMLTSYEFEYRCDKDIIYATKLILDHDKNFLLKYASELDQITHDNIISVPDYSELYQYTDNVTTGDVYSMIIKYIHGNGDKSDILNIFISEGIGKLKEDGYFICTLGMINRMLSCFIQLDDDKILGNGILTNSHVSVEITNKIYKYVFGEKTDGELKNIKKFLDLNENGNIPYNIIKNKNVDGNLFNCYIKDIYFEYEELLDKKKIKEAIEEILEIIKDEL